MFAFSFNILSQVEVVARVAVSGKQVRRTAAGDLNAGGSTQAGAKSCCVGPPVEPG